MKSNTQALSFITESEIRHLLNLRSQARNTKSRLEFYHDSIRLAEQALIAKIEQGALRSCGPYSLLLREVSRRTPAWKELFIGIAGKEAAEAVIDQTEPKVYQALVVEVA